MLNYRSRLYRRADLAEAVIDQHAVVLGRGTIEGGLHDAQLRYRYQVHFLRDQPVEPLLEAPHLAPFAALADVPDAQRATVLRRALDLVASVADAHERRVLADSAADLARLYLDAATITQVWEASAMSIPSFKQDVYEQVYEEIHGEAVAEGLAKGQAEGLAKGQAEGLAKGQAEGLAKGRAEGERRAREAMLVALLRRRFGAVPGVTSAARRLASLDVDEALERIERAGSFDDLASA